MYAKNKPVMKRNNAVLNYLPGELYTIKTYGKVPNNCKHPLTTESKTNKHRRFTEFGQGMFRKVYAKFSDEKAGLKTLRSSYLGRQNSWVPIGKYEAEIPIKKGSASPSIKRIQFSLTLAWTSNGHKV